MFGRWLARQKCKQAVPAVTIFAASGTSLAAPKKSSVRRGTGQSSELFIGVTTPAPQRTLKTIALWPVRGLLSNFEQTASRPTPYAELGAVYSPINE